MNAAYIAAYMGIILGAVAGAGGVYLFYGRRADSKETCTVPGIEEFNKRLQKFNKGLQKKNFDTPPVLKGKLAVKEVKKGRVPLSPALAQKVRARIKQDGTTQMALANALGINDSTFSHYLNDKDGTVPVVVKEQLSKYAKEGGFDVLLVAPRKKNEGKKESA